MSNDERPAPTPDPGNSPPEKWTEDLDPEEVKKIADRLQQESGDS